jgi:hypothetical protein
MTMTTTAERMGVEGSSYGARTDAALSILTRRLDMSHDDKLCLAWALVDQASSLRTTREAQAAMTAIEALWEAEEGSE